MEVEGDSHRSLIRHHPFFRMYMKADQQAVRRLCYTASTVWLAKGDDLFSTGTASSCMYFVIRGHLRYFRLRGDMTRDSLATASEQEAAVYESSRSRGSTVCAAWQRFVEKVLAIEKWAPDLASIASMQVQDLSAGDWCSEAALWVPWVHRGTLRATDIACELLAIDAQKFQTLTLNYENVRVNARIYAQTFATWLNGLERSRLSDLDTFEEVRVRIKMSFGMTAQLYELEWPPF